MLSSSIWQKHWFNVMFAQQAKLQLGQVELTILAPLQWLLHQYFLKAAVNSVQPV